MKTKQYDHVGMIKTPDDWPQWPVLPVKKEGQGDRPIGTILEMQGHYDKNGPITIWFMSMFQNIDDDTPHQTYESAEAIVADGWIVD